MGIFKHLLFWPVTGPMFLTEFSLGKVQGVVKEQLTDDSRVKEALLDLQLRMELGEIDDEEYVEEEARIMAELREVRRWREEFGMATRGGVVQVGDAESPAERAGEGEPAGTTPEEPPPEPPTVPRGATLDVTLDWWEDEDDDDESEAGQDEDGGWSDSSSDDSTPASS